MSSSQHHHQRSRGGVMGSGTAGIGIDISGDGNGVAAAGSQSAGSSQGNQSGGGSRENGSQLSTFGYQDKNNRSFHESNPLGDDDDEDDDDHGDEDLGSDVRRVAQARRDAKKHGTVYDQLARERAADKARDDEHFAIFGDEEKDEDGDEGNVDVDEDDDYPSQRSSRGADAGGGVAGGRLSHPNPMNNIPGLFGGASGGVGTAPTVPMINSYMGAAAVASSSSQARVEGGNMTGSLVGTPSVPNPYAGGYAMGGGGGTNIHIHQSSPAPSAPAAVPFGGGSGGVGVNYLSGHPYSHLMKSATGFYA